MRTLITLLAGLAVGAAAAVYASARAGVRTRSGRHRQMPDVTVEPEHSDA